MKFYQAVGIERSVGSRPGYSSYGLRGLLSVKYFFDDTCDNDDPEQECCFTDKSGDPKMFGFEFYKNTNGWDVYIDGKKADVREEVDIAFIGTDIEPGEHEVDIIYHSKGALEGLLVTLAGVILTVFIMLMWKKQSAAEPSV